MINIFLEHWQQFMDQNKQYSCYIVLCADNTYYTGIAIDVSKRIAVHNTGKGSKYVRCRLPVKLVYSKVIGNKSNALKFEIKVKKLSHNEKALLINEKIKPPI